MDESASHEVETTPSPTRSLSKIILSGQPSCVAFVPNRQDLFVIGTYQLDEGTEVGSETDQSQSRSGTVQLFRLEEDGQVTHLQTHDLALAPDQNIQRQQARGAILDLRFCSLSRYQNYFASCTSTGLILLFRLQPPKKSPDDYLHIQLIRSYTIFEDKPLLTSLSWDPHPSDPDEADIAITLSDGRVTVVRINLQQDSKAEAEAKILTTFSHHTESAWTAQWCPATVPGQKRLATGGDDSAIHIITINNNSSTHPEYKAENEAESDQDNDREEALHALDIHAQQTRPTEEHAFDTRTHEAGVTSILPLTIQSNGALILLTGSYDNQVRVLESRPDSRKWWTLSSNHLDGGVWKLDLLATRTSSDGDGESQKESPASGGTSSDAGSATSDSDSSSDSSSNAENKVQHWLVLASCMHAGVRVLEIRRWWNGQDEWEVERISEFGEHGSMCYASAAVPLHWQGLREEVGKGKEGEEGSRWRVVSTSFYDRMLCVWDFAWT